MKNEVGTLMGYLVPFGYLDMKRACEVADEVWMDESSVAEVVDQFKEECGLSGYEWLDPDYVLMDYILQQARNKIYDVTGYDFVNDYSQAGSEIYTYGNYMCSQYDWSDEAKEELAHIVSKYLARLLDDPFCVFLLKELEIEA